MNFQTMNKQRKFIMIAAALGVIAGFLPWKTISAGLLGAEMGQGINGFHGAGMVAFLSFLVAGIIAFAGEHTKPLDKTAWLGALAMGVIALICTIINIVNTSDSGFGFVEVSVGFGCWIALVAALGVTGSAWLFKNPADNLRSGLDSLKKNLSQMTPPSTTASTGNAVTNTNKVAELEKLIQLKNAGHITEEEYQLMKSNLI